MRVPFVAIAAAFASGIALGLHPTLVRNASHIMLSSFFIFIGVLVLVGIILVRIGRLFLATVASLLSWVLLGSLGTLIEEQPLDADHVVSLAEQRRIPLKTPLRWHGHLRAEPTLLSWGYGSEIDLSGFMFATAHHPTSGWDTPSVSLPPAVTAH